MGSILSRLAGFAASLTPDDIPNKVYEAASFCVLDTVSVAVGASGDKLSEDTKKLLPMMFGGGDEATIWDSFEKASISSAIFMNSMMAHTLEMDDVHAPSKAHIGTVVIPAAMALAEKLGVSGKRFLTAVTAGYETEARIARAFNVKEHRKHGWHVTATAGVFGAAAACGNLLGFDEVKMMHALGLAGSMSFGTWAFLGDGTNSKVLNPAHAAVSGYDAAIMAEAGMIGPEHVLEALDGGLFGMMTEDPFTDVLEEGLGTVWEICKMDNKPYPCCRSTHCAIDSIKDMIREKPVDPEDIERIDVYTYKVGVQQCATSSASLSPKTPGQAKFSTPYCVAATLLFGNVTRDSFAENVMNDERIKALIDKVHVHEDERFTELYPAHWGCKTVIKGIDGSVRQMETADPSGSQDRRLTKEEAIEKAHGMFTKTMSSNSAGIISEKLLAVFEQSDVRCLWQL